MSGELPIILTVDVSSGVVHERVQVGSTLLSREACNLDDAGAYVIAQSLDDDRIQRRCERCFPPAPTDVEDGSVE